MQYINDKLTNIKLRKILIVLISLFISYTAFNILSNSRLLINNLGVRREILYIYIILALRLVVYTLFLVTQIPLLFKRNPRKRINDILAIILCLLLLLDIIYQNVSIINLVISIDSINFKEIYSLETLLNTVISLILFITYIIVVAKDISPCIKSYQQNIVYIHPGKLLLFGILTLGIYYIIWYYRVIFYFESQSDDGSPIKEILFVLLIPFYFLYWIYKVSGQVYNEQKKYGIEENSFSVLTLILTIFGLGIISILIIQENINKIYRAKLDTVSQEKVESIS